MIICRFSAEAPGYVFLRKGADDEEVSVQLLRCGVDTGSDLFKTRPAPVQPAGLSQQRQTYLYRNIRPYVRPMYQDATCPAPQEE